MVEGAVLILKHVTGLAMSNAQLLDRSPIDLSHHSRECRVLALSVGSLRCRNLSGVGGRPDLLRTSRKRRLRPIPVIDHGKIDAQSLRVGAN
jgi:hypothetical protein